MYRYAGILSAYGMALADVVHEAQEPAAYVFSKGKKLKINFLLLSKVSILLVVTFFIENYSLIKQRILSLRNACIAQLMSQGFPE